MDKKPKSGLSLVASIALALLIGLGAYGFANRASDGESEKKDVSAHSEDGHNDSEDSHDDSEHSHNDTYEYVDHDTLPEVKIESLSKDANQKWGMKVSFSNFKIDEAAVDTANEPGVGHAHVYVNDKKISRLFSTLYVFEQDLEVGDTVRVGLNTNDHKAYTHDGELIESTFTLGGGADETHGDADDDSEGNHSDSESHSDSE